MRTVVLDTNVLLSNPDAIADFPDAEVIIPDTVLSEIDKLKTARVDAELKFKGRQISRLLFDLSEKGALQDGVDLPTGGRLRVVSLRNEGSFPEGLSPRNADDRILAIAIQSCAEGCDRLTLVTNDLNMLLKAQTYGVEVERIEGVDSFTRRFIVRPFQRYRIPLTILAVALAVFAAIIYLVTFSPFALGRQTGGVGSLPTEFVDQLSVDQQQVLTYLYKLEANPSDLATTRALAILYDSMSQQNITYLPYAINQYEASLKLAPDDPDLRTDLATAYYRAGKADPAMKEISQVLRKNPSHINANFNLGIFYLNAKPKQYQKAANQFSRVIRLTENSPSMIDTLSRARSMLDSVVKDAAAAGDPISLNGGTL